MDNFLAIGIIGASMSVLFQWIKGKYGIESSQSRMIMIGASFFIGLFYWTVSSLAIWESILGVLAASSTVYAMFFSVKK